MEMTCFSGPLFCMPKYFIKGVYLKKISLDFRFKVIRIVSCQIEVYTMNFVLSKIPIYTFKGQSSFGPIGVENRMKI